MKKKEEISSQVRSHKESFPPDTASVRRIGNNPVADKPVNGTYEFSEIFKSVNFFAVFPL